MPFLDIQLCLDSSGDRLVSRKSFTGEEQHNICADVGSSANMERLAGQTLVLNLSLSWYRWCGFAFVFLEHAAALSGCQELETNSSLFRSSQMDKNFGLLDSFPSAKELKLSTPYPSVLADCFSLLFSSLFLSWNSVLNRFPSNHWWKNSRKCKLLRSFISDRYFCLSVFHDYKYFAEMICS